MEAGLWQRKLRPRGCATSSLPRARAAAVQADGAGPPCAAAVRAGREAGRLLAAAPVGAPRPSVRPLAPRPGAAAQPSARPLARPLVLPAADAARSFLGPRQLVGWLCRARRLLTRMLLRPAGLAVRCRSRRDRCAAGARDAFALHDTRARGCGHRGLAVVLLRKQRAISARGLDVL
jgi:hypothetical protein